MVMKLLFLILNIKYMHLAAMYLLKHLSTIGAQFILSKSSTNVSKRDVHAMFPLK